MRADIQCASSRIILDSSTTHPAVRANLSAVEYSATVDAAASIYAIPAVAGLFIFVLALIPLKEQVEKMYFLRSGEASIHATCPKLVVTLGTETQCRVLCCF